MKKNMIKATNITTNETVYVVVPDYNTKTICDLLDEANANHAPNKYVVFESGNVALTDLPEEIQEKVKSILRAYNKVNVTYEYSEFHVSAGCCIKSTYNHDHFPCGTYRADEVYTEEERRQNYFEEFGYDEYRTR